ncbi:feruloyl-CoA synthase [Thalassobaculum salexigens]|uniref:feruloyl-CoA synthase n=1 Tax=Thalassobaculum salexigens TaxID=455360 RepID=UPI000423DA76|nr:feruloyl-CoA synthase [Thalassobaculum salexigens]
MKPARKRAPFALPDIAIRRDSDGTVHLRSRTPPAPHPETIIDHLDRWASRTPDRTLVAERQGDGWRAVSFAEAARASRGIATALIARGIGAVMALSENSVDQALLMLGAFRAGVPFCPVSPAYSLLSRDFAKLKQIVAIVRPGLVLAEGLEPFERARAGVDFGGAEIVGDVSALAETKPGDLPTVSGDDVAKILFTSGSTGTPKGVINTHRMLASNQAALGQVWPFLAERPPVMLDWLPWSHTFGGNQNLGLAISHGGTLYIDDGRPTAERIARTAENLALVRPTLHFNVPRGLDMLLPYLEADDGLRDRFFESLEFVFYAGATLPLSLWRRVEALGLAATGELPVLTTCYGTTETAPMALAAHLVLEETGVVGVPVPGVEAKLVPTGDKLQIALRGPNITPGYAGRDDLTAEAFDADGYFLSGDAVRLADPVDPNAGIVFDGRIAEDFKLSTGTWVSVGALRVAVIANCGAAVSDVVIAGHDRDAVGALVFAKPGATVATIREGLARHNAANPASSTRIARALVMDEPPNVDAGEITDKGYLNQRRILERRSDRVWHLFAVPPARDVIVL